MSLVQDLADQLRTARDELPVAEVAGAAERLRTAAGLLTWVLEQSAQPSSAPSLGAAASHLEHAAAALRVAQDALDGYALALGMPVDTYPADRGWHAAVAVPVQAGRGRSETERLADWWGTRVAEITQSDSDVTGVRGVESSAELLQRCVAAALQGDRAALHRDLTVAGPAVGLGLTAVAPPLLRHLATEIVGHPPRMEDLARVRRAGLSLVAEMLPELALDAADEILARICRTRLHRTGDRGPAHPVDTAATAALLVAGLLRANGQRAEDLAEVVQAEQVAAQAAQQRASERAEAHRTALRITDTARRHSAVDELRPAPVRQAAAAEHGD